MSMAEAMGKSLKKAKNSSLENQLKISKQKGFPGKQIKIYLMEKYLWSTEEIEEISNDIQGFKNKNPHYFI